ncbi:MAG: MASE1 domain-containing protein [bacterium]|nr:MASE1 domain-containing protein [bacterium]
MLKTTAFSTITFPISFIRSIPRRRLLLGSLIFSAYLVAAGIGLLLHPAGTLQTIIWPPTGIALAAFALYGYRFWPAVALAVLITNLWTGEYFLSALGVAAGNTLGPLLGALVLKRYFGFLPRRIRLRDSVGILAAACLSPLVTAGIAAASLWLTGAFDKESVAATWVMWWIIADALGILVFGSMFINWLMPSLYSRTKKQYLELACVLIATAVAAYFIFWLPQNRFSYYIFIPLGWAALRTGPRGTSFAVMLAAAISSWGTLAGFGPFAHLNVLYLQGFLIIMTVLPLFFSALVEENRNNAMALTKHVNDLERALYKISSEDEAKKEFIAILAHELRNPLSAILSSVELLKLQGTGASDSPQQLQMIDERVRSMAIILENLLDISRISHNKFKLDKKVIALCDVIERSASTLQTAMHARKQTLSITKPPEKIYIEADATRFEQVINNLLSNAIKYTAPGGAIEIVITREDATAVIRVRDSGIGIPQTMLTRIFEPFFQINRANRTSAGLGIGLSLARQLVEMHGGTIEAVSQGESKGSEFIVRLPIIVHPNLEPATDTKTLGASPNRTVRQAKNSLRILVVDDNEPAAESLGRLLFLRGHTVEVAFNGAEAIEKTRRLRPQAVILDIGLPDMDGYAVAHMIRRSKGPQPFLIALTGYGQREDKEQARKVGFDRHLTKPVGLKEVEAALRKMPRTSED